MTGAPTVADRLAAALPGPVERRETHGAWVLLDGDRALKVRKPVRFSFLDYSTPGLRREAAQAELLVNQLLAPSVYRAVRAVVDGPNGLRLADADHPEAIDYVVEMRRFDESRTLAAALGAGADVGETVDAVGRALAAFHAAAPRCGRVGERPFARRVEADLADIERLATHSTSGLRTYATGALRWHGAELDRRAILGLRRDGHGDLRAEHVVLEDPLLIVDRLEFDAALRCADVGSDLAFLAMDLEHLGDRAAARRLVEAYRAAGGNPGRPRLHALFAWQRAVVRTKVALLRHDQTEADALLALAGRLAWRDRAPAVTLVLGPPASGKSTLADRLGALTELPVVSTDVVRKAQHGRAPTERLAADAYTDEATRAVYQEVATRAGTALATAGGVVIDATARTRALRDLLLAELAGVAPAVALTCVADPAERRRRALARESDPGRVSDADAAVAERLGAAFEPVEAFEPFDLAFDVRTDERGGDPLEPVAAGLDRWRARRR